MAYQPSSKVLLLTICSLGKLPGGSADYDAAESLGAALPAGAWQALQARREIMRQLVQTAKDLNWQGVRLAELEFNNQLVAGRDFGGADAEARYMAALQRYDGRFFQTLGRDGKVKLYRSAHHVLFISGLYGLVKPFESIQLYSCPVKPQVAAAWRDDDLLTVTLSEYVARHNIRRVLDLTAVAAYRNLIDWPAFTAATDADVLHCFDRMGAGDSALVPFGKLMKSFLLEAEEGDLLALAPETSRDTVVFRRIDVPLPGLPIEEQNWRRAEQEIPLLEAYPLEMLSEVMAGGQPMAFDASAEPEGPPYELRERHAPYSIRSGEWMFKMTSEFLKNVNRLDRKMQGRVMAAITEVCRNPMTPQGDTVQEMSGNRAGQWRRRMGDYRLEYLPDPHQKVVSLLNIEARGSVYNP